MKKIYSKIDPECLLSVLIKKKDITSERTDLAPDIEPLQGSTKKLKKGDKFNPHTHNYLPRQTHTTQEAWIVIEGEILISLYDLNNKLFFQETLNDGDCILNFRAGHTFEVTKEDTLLYEFKNGPYMGVRADKTLIEDEQD